MALGYGLSGKVRGKVGSKVYRIENGKQIISEYNPTRTEIPSDKQIEVRGRMALANAISRLFPFEAIVGFSPMRSRARHRFLSSIFAATGGEWIDNAKYEATFSAENLRFSDGIPVQVVSKSVNRISMGNPLVNGSLTIAPDAGIVRFLFVLLWQDATSGEFTNGRWAWSSEPNASGTMTATIPLAAQQATIGGVAYGYAVPMIANNAAKRTIYSELMTAVDEDKFTTAVAVALKRADIVGGTIYLGSANR